MKDALKIGLGIFLGFLAIAACILFLVATIIVGGISIFRTEEKTTTTAIKSQLPPFTPTEIPSEAPPCEAIPTSFRQQSYVDEVVGIQIEFPDDWIVAVSEPGSLAILQSFTPDKYGGSEGINPDDTKCDLIVHSQETPFEEQVIKTRTHDDLNIHSENKLDLCGFSDAIVFRVESDYAEQFAVLHGFIHNRVITLACYGDNSLFDEISATLRSIH